MGSLLTGSGFVWDKFHAFASDWGAFAAAPQGVAAGFTAGAAPVSGYDIWSGVTRPFFLPHAEEEVLLGKQGTLLDRHSMAGPLAEIHLEAPMGGAGYLNYAPLVGLPEPQELVRGPAAFCCLNSITTEYAGTQGVLGLG